MIYEFLADGFEETEAIAPVDLLRRSGKTVLTVGVTGKTVKSSHNIPIVADVTVEEISLDGNLEMIILPGGLKGVNNLEKSPEVNAAIDYCHKNDIFIAAICAAPTILGKKGLLKGKTATCYGGMEEDLIGAKYIVTPAVIDGKIITGRGAGASVEFGLKLIEALISKSKADETARRIMFGV